MFGKDAKKEYERFSKIENTKTRMLPAGPYEPGLVNIIDDVVLINYWSTEREPVVLKIRDRKIAEMYKKYFKILWGTARK